ncbi:D-amino-acid transaminase [Nitratireductor sp. GZWM139]|uniref:D-amino-acid transaminase n=1 Tax=Nitratireductor sp. GZWM139 TaxID=2950541 RepID=UPI0024BDB25C|nr:D-amino-acid transaminase [Nitratireductor sp. GZWM139]MDJ1466032.1 D-amino-acid transaminase [Nitratireductor sp. GZWM139]
MSGIVFRDGAFLPAHEASVSIFDRGFLMADGVYEVTCVFDGKLVDFDGHLARLKRSLAELDLPMPMHEDSLLDKHRRLIALNSLRYGMVYLQITRGNPGVRDFLYPDPQRVAPTVVMLTIEQPHLLEAPEAQRGLKVVTMPDLRWGRRDIKTVQLLYPSRAKTKAREAGADDAWLVQDGMVTEGTANNAWIVKGRQVVTRQLSPDILAGVTRAAIKRLAEQTELEMVERAFSVEEAQAADEAFISGATHFAFPVVRIDDKPVGTGKPGPITTRLHQCYLDEIRKIAI